MKRSQRIRDIFDAAGSGDVESVQRFLADGVDPNSVDADNLTPIHFASGYCHIGVIRVLLEVGAKLNVSNPEIGYTPLMYASFEGWPEVVRILIEAGAYVNAKTVEGETALYIASSTKGVPYVDATRRTEVVELLLNAGADVNSKTGFGSSPLTGASFAGSLERVKLLVEHGADLFAKTSKGESALSYAVTKGYTEVAVYLEAAIAKHI